MNAIDRLNLFVLNSGLTKDIYTVAGDDNKIAKATKDIIKMVGGVGGLLFTLAILIIAIVIIFGSISPRNIGTVWKALFSCIAGAVLFYSAYFLADAISKIIS